MNPSDTPPPTTPLRALSIRQPWAWLVLHGGKDVENRTWATKHRGRFLVHAGQQVERDAYLWVRNRFPHLAIPHPGELPRSGIVGAVDLVDCFGPDATDHDGRQSLWYMGHTGFVLRNPVAFDRVPCPGKLGFFKLDEAVLSSCEQGLAGR